LTEIQPFLSDLRKAFLTKLSSITKKIINAGKRDL